MDSYMIRAIEKDARRDGWDEALAAIAAEFPEEDDPHCWYACEENLRELITKLTKKGPTSE